MAAIIPFSPEYEDYLRDESRRPGWAESISFPQDEQELRQTVRETGSLPLTIQGGRTGLAAGAAPNGGHVLNLSHMNRVLSISESQGRFTLEVQPGLLLCQLRTMLASRQLQLEGDLSPEAGRALDLFKAAPRQFFPPDPTESTASLGGMAACNSSGACSYKYGPTRPHIRGLHLVLADGDMLELQRGQCRAQGRELHLTTVNGRTIRLGLPDYELPLCKNAAGYYVQDGMDAVDLFIGSDGTLGIISQLTLELLPQPAHSCGLTCFFSGRDEEEAREQALTYVEGLRGREEVAAIEYFDGPALELLRQRQQEEASLLTLGQLREAWRAAIYIELHSNGPEQARQALAQLAPLLQQAGGSPDQTRLGWSGAELQRLHQFRHAIPETANLLVDRLKREHPTITKHSADMAVPRGRLRSMLEMYTQDIAAGGYASATWGHIGDDHLHVNLFPRDEDQFAAIKQMQRAWAVQVCAWGGTVTAEHGVGKIKAPFLQIMYGAEGLAAMAGVKQALDPQGRLSPGNWFRQG